MLVWLTLPFYDFCGFRSVAVNSVHKLQFFYIYNYYNKVAFSAFVSIVTFEVRHFRILQFHVRCFMSSIFSRVTVTSPRVGFRFLGSLGSSFVWGGASQSHRPFLQQRIRQYCCVILK